MKKKIYTVLAKKVVYIPLAVVLLLAGGIFAFSILNKPTYETAVVSERDFIQEISTTGKVVAASDVNLSFESGGKVSSVPVTVGTKVKQGTVLANVGGGDLYASLLGAQARLQLAQADLDTVVGGTRRQELINIEDSLTSAKTNLIFTIKNSYAISDDAIRSKIDIMFNNPTGSYPVFPGFGDSDARIDIQDERVEITKMLEDWNRSLADLDISGSEQAYLKAKANLNQLASFIEKTASASSYFDRTGTIEASDITLYVASISSARTAVNTAINSLNAAYQAYVTAQGKYDLAAEGSTSEEIARAEASVKSAEASVLQAQASLSKTTITAPFSGVVTKTDLRVGQFVSPGAPVVSMISDANFEIESFVPEADIAKVQVGFVGTTTLDAYGDDVSFAIVVTSIDLSETEVDGVSTYKAKLQFIDKDDRIRSGMTANIDLNSSVRTGVLSVPQSALISLAGKRSVLVMDSNGKTKSRDVTTGSIDNSGNIEIKSGLEAGEVVVTNPPKK